METPVKTLWAAHQRRRSWKVNLHVESCLSCTHFFPFICNVWSICISYLFSYLTFMFDFRVLCFIENCSYLKKDIFLMLFNKRFPRAPFFLMESKILVISMTTAVPPDGRRLPSKTYRSVKIFVQYTVTFSVFPIFSSMLNI